MKLPNVPACRSHKMVKPGHTHPLPQLVDTLSRWDVQVSLNMLSSLTTVNTTGSPALTMLLPDLRVLSLLYECFLLAL